MNFSRSLSPFPFPPSPNLRDPTPSSPPSPALSAVAALTCHVSCHVSRRDFLRASLFGRSYGRPRDFWIGDEAYFVFSIFLRFVGSSRAALQFYFGRLIEKRSLGTCCWQCVFNAALNGASQFNLTIDREDGTGKLDAANLSFGSRFEEFLSVVNGSFRTKSLFLLSIVFFQFSNSIFKMLEIYSKYSGFDALLDYIFVIRLWILMRIHTFGNEIKQN